MFYSEKQQQEKGPQKQCVMTYMLPVAELLSVGREELERSICANLRAGKKKTTHQLLSVTEAF